MAHEWVILLIASCTLGRQPVIGQLTALNQEMIGKAAWDSQRHRALSPGPPDCSQARIDPRWPDFQNEPGTCLGRWVTPPLMLRMTYLLTNVKTVLVNSGANLIHPRSTNATPGNSSTLTATGGTTLRAQAAPGAGHLGR